VSLKKSESTKRWPTSVPNLKVPTVVDSAQYPNIEHTLFFLEGSLNGYQKKKYVCKLLYMYILGWDIDFGHMEAVNLISSPKYSEKQIVSLNKGNSTHTQN
jgi:hypothetical protein